jgi:hypothetical protein
LEYILLIIKSQPLIFIFIGLMGAPDSLQVLCQFHPACSEALRGALRESGAPILQTRSGAEGLQNKIISRFSRIRGNGIN